MPGQQCSFDTDCTEPLVCAGGYCRAACAGDRDCAEGLRCLESDRPGGRVCLPRGVPVLCAGGGRSTCPEGATCQPDHTCHARCDADDVCQHLGSTTCDLTAGVCRAPVTVTATGDPQTDAGPGDALAADHPDGATEAGSDDLGGGIDVGDARVHMSGASGRLVGVPAGTPNFRGVEIAAGAAVTVTVPFRVMSAVCEVSSFEVFNSSVDDGAFFITDVASGADRGVNRARDPG